jgi:dUTPase
MIIIKETNREIGTLGGYNGICDGCQIDLEYKGDLVVIKVDENDEEVVLVSKDRIICPNCNKEIVTMKLYKNLEISRELNKIKK